MIGRLLVAFALATVLRAPAVAATHFAVVGDLPYSSAERALMPAMLAEIAATGAAFIVHVGDLKGGRAPCTDALYEDRRALFAGVGVPFVFVPGDNDWTDCALTLAGGHDPEERLATLRRIFYPDDRALGAGELRLQRQSAAYPEHQRWRFGDLLLLTVNVPGGSNHWGTGATPGREFLTRMAAVHDWIDEGFQLAARDDLAAVVLLMQADPAFQTYRKGVPNRAYATLLDQISDRTRHFPGTVVVAHGDTHQARVDQPLPALANLWRIEPPGAPFMGWIRVDLTPESKPGLRGRVELWAPP